MLLFTNTKRPEKKYNNWTFYTISSESLNKNYLAQRPPVDDNPFPETESDFFLKIGTINSNVNSLSNEARKKAMVLIYRATLPFDFHLSPVTGLDNALDDNVQAVELENFIYTIDSIGDSVRFLTRKGFNISKSTIIKYTNTNKMYKDWLFYSIEYYNTYHSQIEHKPK